MEALSSQRLILFLGLLQVCFWDYSCPPTGRLAGYACRAHWFHAYGTCLLSHTLWRVNYILLLKMVSQAMELTVAYVAASWIFQSLTGC